MKIILDHCHGRTGFERIEKYKLSDGTFLYYRHAQDTQGSEMKSYAQYDSDGLTFLGYFSDIEIFRGNKALDILKSKIVNCEQG